MLIKQMTPMHPMLKIAYNVENANFVINIDFDLTTKGPTPFLCMR